MVKAKVKLPFGITPILVSAPLPWGGVSYRTQMLLVGTHSVQSPWKSSF